ncbi:MAG: dTDP-4-dehydrorhamnose 3,5-epimerase family protein, partial [Ignavibacteriaceae bacterium]
MKIEKTNFDGILIIQPDIFEDSRGLFFESFNKEKYEKGGIADKFVQDNISKSCQNTIRGLHLQIGEKA